MGSMLLKGLGFIEGSFVWFYCSFVLAGFLIFCVRDVLRSS
jgi:hypothetical protein